MLLLPIRKGRGCDRLVRRARPRTKKKRKEHWFHYCSIIDTVLEHSGYNGPVKLTAEQVECLSSTTRLAIFEAFSTLGESSVLEIAELIGGPPTSLYYHVEQLLKAGLLVQTGSRQANTRVELLYKPASTRLVIDKLDRSAKHRAALKRSLKSALKDAEKDFSSAQESSDERDPTQLLRLTPRLSEEDAEGLKRKLSELGEWVRSRETPDGQPFSITAVFTPRRKR